MNTSLHPITSFPTPDNCSSYVCSKKARCPSLIFLWRLLQFFVCSKTCHLHQSFFPEREGFSQGWATFYTVFTLHLSAKKKRERKTKLSLCLFQGQESRREAMSQFYYEISWGRAQHVWKQQVLAVEGKLAGLCWGPSEGGERRNTE